MSDRDQSISNGRVFYMHDPILINKNNLSTSIIRIRIIMRIRIRMMRMKMKITTVRKLR